MELGNRAIGTRGELLVAAEFLKRGCAVYTPLVDIGADMVVDIGGKLQRVQVKSCDGEGERYQFRLGRRVPHTHGWSSYDKSDVDWYALCWLDREYVALVPAGDATTARVLFGAGGEKRRNEIQIGTVLDRLLKES